MWPRDVNGPFQVGDWVRIKNSAYDKVRVAESLGAIGPKGVRVYRILLRRKPRDYVAVMEDQLEHFVEEPVPGIEPEG